MTIQAAIKRSLRKYWYAYAMVAPVVIVLGVLVLYPLVQGLYYSLTNATGMNVGRDIGVNHIPATFSFVGLDNYVNILGGQDGTFYSRLSWTVIWTTCCVVAQVGIGLLLAVMLNREMRLRAVYRIMLILPWAVPGFVAAFSWRLLLNGNGGVVNSVLAQIGIHGPDWLGQPLSAKVSVILVNVWIGIPFNMVSILGGLQSISPDLYEAAEIDGASPWQRFRAVTSPGLRSVSGTIILLGVIWTFNQFAIINLMTDGGPGGATEILVTQAYRDAFRGVQNYATASTYGAIILSILIVFTTFYRRSLRKNEIEVAS